MKVLIITALVTIIALGFSACGCSSSANESQTPGTTILPDTLPTIGSNIPDPNVDTEMPIYTEGPDDFFDTDPTAPSNPMKTPHDR